MTKEQNYKSLFYSYSWANFEVDIKNLAEKVWVWKVKYILAVTNWWLIPAYYLAKLLKVEWVKTINLSSYKWQTRDEIIHTEIEWFSEIIKNPNEWLIIDEIVDSGKTLQFVQKLFPSVRTASIFVKPNVKKPTYYIKETSNWIRFPWERTNLTSN